MQNILDMFFTNDAFSTVELTEAINVVPNQYGRLREIGLFGQPIGISTTQVFIEYNNGVLNLLPTRPRGASGTQAVTPKRQGRAFEAFHIPHDDEIKAADVQNVRAFGTGDVLQGVMDVVNDRLITARNKHAITLEHLRMGAVKGQIVDADGSTLIDLFSEFQITQKVVDFTFGTVSASPKLKTFEVVRHIEDNLLGETMTSVHALCSPEFFDGLVEHEDVKRVWDNWNAQSNNLGVDPRRGFPLFGVTWEEYRGQASHLQEDGSTVNRRFVPAGDVRFFPLGTQQAFRSYFAPGDFIEAVNTPGLELYAKIGRDPNGYDRFVPTHTQSNPIPLCTRPALLVRGHSSN